MYSANLQLFFCQTIGFFNMKICKIFLVVCHIFCGMYRAFLLFESFIDIMKANKSQESTFFSEISLDPTFDNFRLDSCDKDSNDFRSYVVGFLSQIAGYYRTPIGSDGIQHSDPLSWVSIDIHTSYYALMKEK